MLVSAYDREWQVEDVRALEDALAWRDSRGGACFWLTHEDERYPALAIRVSGDVADVHFFPEEDHPGFRCLGGTGLPADGWTTIVFEGCDPGIGEDTPNEFIVPFVTAGVIAMDFFLKRRRSEAVSWLEL